MREHIGFRFRSEAFRLCTQSLRFLFALALLFVAFFLLGKAGFMLYNREAEPFTLRDLFDVWTHGLSMDLSTTGYLIVLPWLCCLVSLWWQDLPLRRVLLPYYVVVSLALSAIVVGDMVMYEFWKFKLDSTVFAYLHSTQGATSSVSSLFLVTRLSTFLFAALLLLFLLVRLTPQGLTSPARTLLRMFRTLLWLLLGGVIFLFIRGGWQESTMNVGAAYYSPRLYLNHAAVNPAFSLLSSVSKNKDFARQFQLLPEDQRSALFDGLYHHGDTTLTDTLLRTPRPDVLIVLVESFGGKFVHELGGLPDVAPNLSRLIPQGIFFDNFWANSFRTDRGTVSVFSGWLSYPTASLMRIPGRSAQLPSIAHSLAAAGYQCDYLYGGDIKIMGKRGYLVSTGYTRLTYDRHFTATEVNESKWGANDSVTSRRVLQLISRRTPGSRWHMGYQTLSSHEPWEVPYHRLDDKVQNAFAYTDHCLGQLIDSLRTLPQWDSLLVVLLPDHGSLYRSSYQDPEFFHIPMLWLGGALREPRRVHTLMNQSDLAATLLGQMHLSYTHLPWSRNVLSRGYTRPFVYATFPGGILLRDSTGTSVWDLGSRRPIVEQPTPSPHRVRQAKAILQTSYQQLGERR